jgi:glycosyltransferase involved in cell wall biosynthesis
MRIVYFTDTYRIGGAERFLADLAAGVRSAGHEVIIVSPQREVLEFVGAAAAGAELIRTKVDYSAAGTRRSHVSALLRGVPELRAVIARTRPEILHVNNGGYPGSDLNRLAAIVARFAGAPKCVLTIQAPAFPRNFSQPQVQALSDRLTWRSVDAVHVTSEFLAQSLAARGFDPGLCRVIPLGAREPSESPDAAAELRDRLAPGGRLLVGLISATGEPEKGHAVLVNALAKADIDVPAVIVGPQPEDPLADLVDELGLSARVELVGPVTAGEVGRYLQAIDVLVVPSTSHESMTLVALEAMAAGKPVFASRLSGIPEAVIDGVTGRLFPPGDVDALAALLREAATDPESLARFGEAGHRRWAERFSIESMVTAMLVVYEELLSTSGQARERPHEQPLAGPQPDHVVDRPIEE